MINLSALLIIISLMVTKGPHRLFLRKIRFNRTALKKTLHIGVPSGVQSGMYSISNLVIQAAVNSFGTVVVAAWAAISKFDGVYWVTSNAFGLAICAFVGQCFGAGLIDRMKRGVRICLALAAGTSVVMSVTLLSLSRFGISLLSNDPAVIQCGVQLLYYFAPFYVIWSVVEIMSNTLRGVGDSVLPMLIVILGVCVLRVLWVVFVVPVWHTIMGVSMSYAITWTVTAIAMVVYYKKSKWMERCSRLV